MAQRQAEHPDLDVEDAADERPPVLARLNAKGFRLVMVADAVVVFGSMAAVVLARIRLLGGSPTAPGRDYVLAFLGFTMVFMASYYFGGLYERQLRLGHRPILPQVASLSVVPWLTIPLVALMLGEYYIPRRQLPLLLVLIVLGVTFNRLLSRVVRQRQFGPPRVLLAGTPDEIRIAESHADLDPTFATVVGHAPNVSELVQRVQRSEATDVLLLSSQMLDQVYPEPLGTLERMNVAVLQRVSARDTLLGLEGVREVGGMPFVALRRHTFPNSRARFKRTIELLLLLLLAVPALLAAAFIALYVRVTAGKHVLFWQERVGRDGIPFRLVKFRTLQLAAPAGADGGGGGTEGDVWSTPGTPLPVPACRWLRTTRLDELPQLWNVLRGEMSLVGPRPFTVEQTTKFVGMIPGYARRHEIPPGITGLAQINGRYHTDPEYKLGHDLQYLVNWSPILDLQILLRTVYVILARRV